MKNHEFFYFESHKIQGQSSIPIPTSSIVNKFYLEIDAKQVKPVNPWKKELYDHEKREIPRETYSNLFPGIRKIIHMIEGSKLSV